MISYCIDVLFSLVLTGQCLASNGKCGTKGLTCEQKFGQGWIKKGRCCNEKPCCGEEESTGKFKPEINYSCGFETTVQCIFRQTGLDDFDYTRGSGFTPTGGTGPNSAAEGLWYMYIETSGTAIQGKAVLTTEATNLQACPWCLSFQYHMKGKTLGTLRVLAGDKTSSLSSIWEKTGEQPNPDSWKTATISIPQYSNLGITIEASKRSANAGGVTLLLMISLSNLVHASKY
ncbi:unnamed protein product [Mytilus edulis]|uniref:MAM domain-containing protein n=1 Tax=Mytilus edulis TaxID=6550 RepID=A0A8S3VHU3_MYTED|nr:unnamed protein product [Mytilus edulis]